MDDNQPNLAELTSNIVAAFVMGNKIPASELPDLIARTHHALADVGATGRSIEEARKDPAVPIKKSITPDYIISLEDGRKLKSMKRYLRTSYDMSPDEYRQKWGLASDYPMVAPNYAAARSHLAKKLGLGQQGNRSAAARAAKVVQAPRKR